jgi:hypothetical protein
MKLKLSWAEERALDVSMCYQQGKTARQRGESRFTNPYTKVKFTYEQAWDTGWTDEDGLINQ